MNQFARNLRVGTCQSRVIFSFTWVNRIRLLRYAFILQNGVQSRKSKSYQLMFRKHHFKTLLGKSEFYTFDSRQKQTK